MRKGLNSLVSTSRAYGGSMDYDKDYTQKPWNLRVKETRTTFSAPRFYFCFLHKRYRLCSELLYASKEGAFDAGVKYIKENFDE